MVTQFPLDKNIVECNKLIALFMGAVYKADFAPEYGFQETYVYPLDKTPTEHSCINWGPEQMEYSFSYDWLMPVVQRIQKIRVKNSCVSVFSVTWSHAKQMYCGKFNYRMPDYDPSHLFYEVHDADMAQCYYAICVYFIKWLLFPNSAEYPFPAPIELESYLPDGLPLE